MASSTPVPQVSVLLPVYNERRFLAEALGSLRAQTLTDFEIVLIDDGSDEDVRLAIEALAKEDARSRPSLPTPAWPLPCPLCPLSFSSFLLIPSQDSCLSSVQPGRGGCPELWPGTVPCAGDCADGRGRRLSP